MRSNSLRIEDNGREESWEPGRKWADLRAFLARYQILVSLPSQRACPVVKVCRLIGRPILRVVKPTTIWDVLSHYAYNNCHNVTYSCLDLPPTVVHIASCSRGGTWLGNRRRLSGWFGVQDPIVRRWQSVSASRKTLATPKAPWLEAEARVANLGSLPFWVLILPVIYDELNSGRTVYETIKARRWIN